MLPGNIRSLCEKLHATPVVDDQKTASLREPSLPRRIKLFLDAWQLLHAHTQDPYYSLYVCTVLGYRRLIVRDGDCRLVDNAIINLLQARPDVIPDDCYRDRLPPRSLLMERIELLYCHAHRVPLSPKYLEAMAAD